MKKIIIAIGILSSSVLAGQSFQYQSALAEPTQKGFYNIPLRPELVGKLQSNKADLRLMDKNNQEVPYYLEKEAFSISKRLFKEYKVIEKIRWRNGATVLYVENEEQNMIDNIQLQIKNFDVRKRLELAGSDNYSEWYTIKENYVFRSANGLDTTSEVKSLHFPYCDYKYYRIIIYDVFSLPINVLKVGYYDTYQEKGKFNLVGKLNKYIIDSVEVKKTYIKLKFNHNLYSDKLVFAINKPEYFYRNAAIALKKKDHKGRWYYQEIDHFVLNVNSDLTLYQNDFPYKEFYVIIDNEDNPSLTIESVEAYQLKRRMVTYLEKDNNYRLVYGNEEPMKLPQYDLTFFKSKVSPNIPILEVGEMVAIEQVIAPQQESQTHYIWIAVVLIAGLLGFISYKMIIEIEKK